MSRQGEQDARWLAGYRLVVAILVLLVILATLGTGYHTQREQAIGTKLTLLGQQFAERVQRLHGRWLDERRPPLLHAQGLGWQFDERGWPLGVAPLTTPSADCRNLWQGIMGEVAPGGQALQFRARLDGCLIGLEGHWLHYRFGDGTLVPWRDGSAER
ncbi:hypothetical protein [Aeromonas bivalvium]|uniref:hypothetical protein n=1 Tax=Aeromonas bivalvium TaxID=440079 RepID=UPI0038D16184